MCSGATRIQKTCPATLLVAGTILENGGPNINISEIQLSISESGTLEIDASHISQMGLFPGDSVYVAYFNTSKVRELLLSPSPLDEISNPTYISIPDPLLNEANLPPGSDLEILCIDGAIIITHDLSFTSAELSEILDALNQITTNFDSPSIDSFPIESSRKE